MKYGVNRVTLVGNVGEVPRVSERDGEAFVANFPLTTNQFYKNKEGEEVRKTERHRIVNMSGTLLYIPSLQSIHFHLFLRIHLLLSNQVQFV